MQVCYTMNTRQLYLISS